MKVNTKKLVLWLVVLLMWTGAMSVVDYSVGQHYGKNVATQQFEDYTTAYKELKTQKKVEDIVNVMRIAGALLFLGLAAKQFKIREEKSE